MGDMHDKLGGLGEFEAKIPWVKGLPYGIQHVLTMFVSNLTPIMLICAAANFSDVETTVLIQNAMLVAGIGTFVQLYGIWHIGARMPIVMGISTAFVALLSTIIAAHGEHVLFGHDLNPPLTLLDAIRVIQNTEGILRIRLGSLEPTVSTPDFAAALHRADKICPQFHLALQSGSDSVLARMKRRYNAAQYLRGVENLRREFPHAAFTTDILTGFPGETEAEFEETKRMIETVGFARIHVFPYSARPDTPAAAMPGQLPAAEKERRARELIALGRRVAERYLETWTGLESAMIPEEMINGCWEGYTPEYIRVRLHNGSSCKAGRPVRIRLLNTDQGVMNAVIIDEYGKEC